jgi:hypothetical protein
MIKWTSVSGIALAISLSAIACADDDAMSVGDAWRADADAFMAVLEAEHDNPFFHTPEPEYRAALAAYKRDVDTMSRAQRIAGLAHLAALVGDGHTWMPMYGLPFDGLPPGPQFRSLPLRFELFEDGLFVVGASPEHAALLGARVTAIGEKPVADAIASIMTLLPNDATSFASEFVAEWLMQAELLAAMGLSESAETISLGLMQNGESSRASLSPLPADAQYDWVFSMDTGPADVEGWFPATSTPPAWQAPVDGMWRVESRGDAAYLQIINIGNAGPQTYAQMAQVAVDLALQSDNPRLVIDLRRCLGGDGTLNAGLLSAITSATALNQPGRIAVLTSRQTHSAAVMLVSDLEQQTHARFYGQPTADRPNHYGETNIFVAPNSHLPIIHASEYYQTSTPDDDRRHRRPDVAIPYLFSDYIAGRDPVLDAALTDMNGQ